MDRPPFLYKTVEVNQCSRDAGLFSHVYASEHEYFTDINTYNVENSLQTPSSKVEKTPVASSQKTAMYQVLNSSINEIDSGISNSPNCSKSIVELQNVQSILKASKNSRDKKIGKTLTRKVPLVSGIKRCRNLQTIKSSADSSEEFSTFLEQSITEDYPKNEANSGISNSPNCSKSIVELQNVQSILKASKNSRDKKIKKTLKALKSSRDKKIGKTLKASKNSRDKKIKNTLKASKNSRDKKIGKTLTWKVPLVSGIKPCRNLQAIKSIADSSEEFSTFLEQSITEDYPKNEANSGISNSQIAVNPCIKPCRNLQAIKSIADSSEEFSTFLEQSITEDYPKNEAEKRVKELLNEFLRNKTTLIFSPNTSTDYLRSFNNSIGKQLNESSNMKTMKVNYNSQSPIKGSKQKLSHCLPNERFFQNEHLCNKEKFLTNTSVHHGSTSAKKARTVEKKDYFSSSFKMKSSISCKKKQSSCKTLLNGNLPNFQKSKPELSVHNGSNAQYVFEKSDYATSSKLCAEAKIVSTLSKKYSPIVSVKRLSNEVYKECIKKGYVILKKVDDISLPKKNKKICIVRNGEISNIVITDKSSMNYNKALKMVSNLKENVFKLNTSTDASNANVFQLNTDVVNKLKKTISQIKSNSIRIIVPLEELNKLQDSPSQSEINKNIKTDPKILAPSPKRRRINVKNIQQKTQQGIEKVKIKIPKKIISKKVKILLEKSVHFVEKKLKLF
ncbi:hypothetical protein TNIN_105211 [Trichonephila inaurata madagascariensis]|uniref:Uncharacterized protein n=1 Tax=Trichonephila inaurata madagascariensis TaxID=2747483 RepID=A0A8X6YKZ1_9ARAC|nr:hypothetical protein TNIN_105211 [Trichonephila inaurata madagascariensis]